MAEVPENAVVAILLAESDVTDLIGTRLFPGVAPQDTRYPYGIYEAPNFEHEHNMDSASGLTQGEVTIFWYGRSRRQVIDVAAAAREALDGFPNSTVAVDGTNIHVEALRLRDSGKGMIPPPPGSDTATHFVEQEYWLAAEESVPTFS